MTRQRIAIYHRVMKRENFEVAAKDLFRLLVNAQKQSPDQPRVLYVDIDGHRNKAGGFDNDMFELIDNEVELAAVEEAYNTIFMEEE